MRGKAEGGKGKRGSGEINAVAAELRVHVENLLRGRLQHGAVEPAERRSTRWTGELWSQ